MHYDPRSQSHGLAHDPLKALVIPRPIGWISTRSASGVANLAPYSFFNLISAAPPMLMFSSSGYKDSIANAEASGCFAVNLASTNLFEAMNRSSASVPPEENEFELAGLTESNCHAIDAPYVAEAKVHMECELHQVVKLPSPGNEADRSYMALGAIVHIRIDDELIQGGLVDQSAMQALARCGYLDYARTTEFFTASRPGAKPEATPTNS